MKTTMKKKTTSSCLYMTPYQRMAKKRRTSWMVLTLSLTLCLLLPCLQLQFLQLPRIQLPYLQLPYLQLPYLQLSCLLHLLPSYLQVVFYEHLQIWLSDGVSTIKARLAPDLLEELAGVRLLHSVVSVKDSTGHAGAGDIVLVSLSCICTPAEH